MGARGDFAKLGRLISKFRTLKRDGARRVTTQLAQEGLALVQECFAHERAPDGTPWLKSQRAIRDGGKTLQDTRRLYNSLATKVLSSTAFRLFTNVVYAAIHNNGGLLKRRLLRGRSRRARLLTLGRMPERRFIPKSGQLPTRWERRLRAVANLEVVRMMK